MQPHVKGHLPALPLLHHLFVNMHNHLSFVDRAKCVNVAVCVVLQVLECAGNKMNYSGPANVTLF